MLSSSSSRRCTKLFFKVLASSLVITLALWIISLYTIRSSIDWTSRNTSATCFNPYNDTSGWGNPNTYNGIWMECEMHNINGTTCTPWGYNCQDDDTFQSLCPLNYGGVGDGCVRPNSIFRTILDMILNLGSSSSCKYPMFPGQSYYFMISMILILPISIFITRIKWERNQHRKYTVPTELLPGVVTKLDDDDDSDDDDDDDVEQKSTYRPIV